MRHPKKTLFETWKLFTHRESELTPSFNPNMMAKLIVLALVALLGSRCPLTFAQSNATILAEQGREENAYAVGLQAYL